MCDTFVDDGSKKDDVPQKEEDTTDYGKAVAKLKDGEKKQRVPKVSTDVFVYCIKASNSGQ